MRSFAIAAAAAPALAAAVPRIELDLSSVAIERLERHVDAGGLGQWARFHVISSDSNARGRQDFTERCAAGTETNAVNCPVPKAHAWDSLDQKNLAVQTQIYLVDDDGTTGVVPKDAIDYSKRRTYLIKYDAQDAAGNKAEQLVFALILDDIKAPRISCDDWSTNGVNCDCSKQPQLGTCQQQCANGADYVIEAASGFVSQSLVAKPNWSLCKDWEAFDLVEGNVNPTISFKVVSPLQEQPVIETSSWTEVNDALTGGTGEKPLGTYTVVVNAHDHAGTYGAGDGSGGATGNNVAEFKKTFIFVDTQSPVVTVLGDAPNHTHECGTKYEDAGAEAKDARDGTIELGKTYAKDSFTSSAKHFSVSSTVDENKNGAYKVTYTANDASNKWARGERYVLVKDTKEPDVALVGDSTVTRYVQKDDLDRIDELGVTVNDECDQLLNGQVFVKAQPGGATSPKVSMTWSSNAQGQNPGNKWPITGEFTRTYQVWDTTSESGAKGTTTRVYNFVDNEEPEVQLNEPAAITVKACRLTDADCSPYVDAGARCFDYVGGEMAQSQITKSGNAVDKSKPGTYRVTYTCKDNALVPNESAPVSRTVTVKDTGCPQITILDNDSPTVIEANFPYADAGATATDDVDNVVTVTSTGNTVNTKSLYSQARSCKDIKTVVSDANSGYYEITSYTAAKGFFTIPVFCDMDTGTTYASPTTDAPVSIVPYGTSIGSCQGDGLVMASYPFTAVATEEFKQLSGNFALNKQNPTNQYLCTTEDTTDTSSTHAKIRAAHLTGARAEPGTYTITYHAKDSEGNTDTSCGAAPSTRTVKVQDTMPPVISLHMQGKLLKSSNPADGSTNPAWDDQQNPFLQDGYFDATTVDATLMAEQSTTSANGWMLAAAASAIAGVALLAASKRTVVTSVPV
jgi:hypothetical protein